MVMVLPLAKPCAVPVAVTVVDPATEAVMVVLDSVPGRALKLMLNTVLPTLETVKLPLYCDCVAPAMVTELPLENPCAVARSS